MSVTIRPTTQEERDWLAARREPRHRYVCVDEQGRYLLSFGIIVNGGHSKAAVVFWAERWASKNGAEYVPPPGWEGIVGSLERQP